MTYIHIEPKAFKEVSMFKWVHILCWVCNQDPRAYSDSAGMQPGLREEKKKQVSSSQQQESQVPARFRRCHGNGGPWDFEAEPSQIVALSTHPLNTSPEAAKVSFVSLPWHRS